MVTYIEMVLNPNAVSCGHSKMSLTKVLFHTIYRTVTYCYVMWTYDYLKLEVLITHDTRAADE